MVEVIITNEENLCLSCNRKIYKDKIVTKTHFGLRCSKCSGRDFKEGHICFIQDFQEFGNVLFLCLKKLLVNVKGERLSNPIWEGLILDAEHKGLRDIWHRRFKEDNCFLATSFEKDLVMVGNAYKTKLDSQSKGKSKGGEE